MDELFARKCADLANRAWAQGIYTFTAFLDLASLSAFHALRPALPPIPHALFGGAQGCERQVLRFGSEEICGYDAPFPISCIHLKPANAKFADDLTHRDVLGAVMSLGIERELIGDIILRDKEAYLFCLERIAPYISESLTQIKHTAVRCKTADTLPQGPLYTVKRLTVQVASPRLDALIAHVYKLSRSDAQALFSARKIYINGRLCESPGYTPKGGEIISVRGFGRMRYIGVESLSKKGKSNTTVEQFV